MGKPSPGGPPMPPPATLYAARMDDRAELAGLVEIWWQAIADLIGLLEQVPADRWSAPTDLPGWDVHAVAAHIAHLESVLAGTDAPPEAVDENAGPGSSQPPSSYTQAGVDARHDRTPEQLVGEIRESAARRHAALLADPPTDGEAPPPRRYPGISWSHRTLLRNRVLDVWMHEQDVRRAVGLAGNLDSAAARHTVDHLTESLGFVLARKVRAPAGTTVVLEVSGHRPVCYTVTDQGRGVPLPAPPERPTVRLALDREPYILLAGGRRRPPADAVSLTGDPLLGRRILDALAVTP